MIKWWKVGKMIKSVFVNVKEKLSTFYIFILSDILTRGHVWENFKDIGF